MFVTLLTFTDLFGYWSKLKKKKDLTTDNINLYEHYWFLVSDMGCKTRAETEET